MTDSNPSLIVSQLLPASVLAAQITKAVDTQKLYAEEAHSLGNVAPKRLQDFTAGRLCARRVLAQLGHHQFALLIGDDRRPVWPQGIIGSITHTHNFCAAIATAESELIALGIDAECLNAVSQQVLPEIATEDEITWLSRFSESDRRHYATLIFSAKEAFYKAQFQLTKSWMGFHDLVLCPASSRFDQGHFSLVIVNPPKGLQTKSRISGHFSITREHLITAISLSTQDRIE